jgi:hypothetical protein
VARAGSNKDVYDLFNRIDGVVLMRAVMHLVSVTTPCLKKIILGF